jgi:hypothetical protein
MLLQKNARGIAIHISQPPESDGSDDKEKIRMAAGGKPPNPR